MWRWRTRHCIDGTLVAFLDDELDPCGEAAARRHIAGCDRCSVRLQQQRAANVALIGLLAAGPAKTQPATERGRRFAGGVAGAGILFASIGAIVAAGIVVYRRHTITAFGNGRS